MSSDSIILSLFLSIKKAEIRKVMGMLMLTQKNHYALKKCVFSQTIVKALDVK